MGGEAKAYKSVSVQGIAALTKTGQFSVKLQAAYGVDYGFHLIFNNTFGIAAVIGYEYFFPSSLNQGFRYKGYGAVSSGFLISIRAPLSVDTEDNTMLFFGSSAGLEGAFARYTDVLTHYFFYLAVTLEPYLDILPIPDGRWFLRVGIPFAYRFRKDADLSLSGGISLHIFHEPGLNILKPAQGEKR